MRYFSEGIIKCFQGLSKFKISVKGVKIMNPYLESEVFNVVKKFYNKFYKDSRKRCFIFGVNPGRFGAGLTGIPFTDPVALKMYCGIENSFPNKKESSAEFVYKVIEKCGGAKNFYKDFFITNVSPIGFIKDDTNFNYYDSKELLEKSKPFIIKTIKEQIKFRARTDVAIVLGKGKNYQIFSNLNKEHKFFDKLIALEHPRYIMQYKRKGINGYIKKYINAFDGCKK